MRDTKRETFSHSKCSRCGASNPSEFVLNNTEREREIRKFISYFNSRIPKNNRTKHSNLNTNTCLRYGSEVQWIANCPKSKKIEKRVHWNTEKTKTCAYKSTKIDKALEKITEKMSHKKYTRLWHVCIPK